MRKLPAGDRSGFELGLLLGCALFCACGPGSQTQPGLAGEITGLRILRPLAGDTLSGTAPVEIELNGGSRFAQLSLSLDGAPALALRALGTGSLETLLLANGPHTLSLRAQTATGGGAEDTVAFEVNNPEQRLQRVEKDREIFASDEALAIDLLYDQPGLDVQVDFRDVDGTSAAVRAREVEPSRYRVEHRLSTLRQRQGWLQLEASKGGGAVVQNRVPLQLRAKPPLPISVRAAYFDDDDLPPGTPSTSASPLRVTGSNALLGAAENTLSVSWDAGAFRGAQGLAVRVDGYSGYYVIPVEPEQSSAQVPISMPSLKPGDAPSTLRLLLGLIGLPRVDFTEFQLKPFAVQSGGIQFMLRWDKPADLDMEVTTPDGTDITFEKPRYLGGGLDLDSNAMCVPAEANAENISWPPGTELPGAYEVRANLYDACGQEDINYELVVTTCGEPHSFPGTFAAADANTNSAGQVVGVFTHSCTQSVVGTVSFEKIDVSRTISPHPGAFLPVRVVRSLDQKVLARGITNKDGVYSLKFGNPSSSPKYRVEVEASWADQIVNQPRATVVDWTSDVPYRYQGREIDGVMEPVAAENLLITVADNSGAFNVIDVMRQGLEFVLARRRVFIPAIGARWQQGVDPIIGTSYYANGTLNLRGVTNDPDEFDDSVISHELMHYVVSRISDDDSLGGSHDGGQVAPRLAWGEGLATTFGQIALKSPVYTDFVGSFTTGQDLDSGSKFAGATPAGFAQGTSDGSMVGDLSEYLIAMVLWDLQDPANEANDLFDREDRAFYGSLFDVIPAGDTDRGVLFSDFVDFLDGFRCMLDPVSPFMRDDDLRKLLNDRKFPYDYALAGMGCDPP